MWPSMNMMDAETGSHASRFDREERGANHPYKGVTPTDSDTRILTANTGVQENGAK